MRRVDSSCATLTIRGLPANSTRKAEKLAAHLTLKTSRLRSRPKHACSEATLMAPGAQRNSPAGPARVSESARAKAETRRTRLPLHGSTAPLADVTVLTLNEVTLSNILGHAFAPMEKATEVQRHAYEFLDIDPGCCHASGRLKPPESAVGPLKREGFPSEPEMKVRSVAPSTDASPIVGSAEDRPRSYSSRPSQP